jgi:6-pyruvoyltetrahydropterin/6-carboxytetrahydropterin synthase
MHSATCTKIFTDLPFAHRQPKHKGHCALIHGHNWSFEFEFQAKAVDANGFVVDFGDLKWVRQWLDQCFDHTLVLNEDDPRRGDLVIALDGLSKIVFVPNCGAEGLAEFVANHIDTEIRHRTNDRVRVMRCTVFEDSKNSATFTLYHK